MCIFAFLIFPRVHWSPQFNFVTIENVGTATIVPSIDFPPQLIIGNLNSVTNAKIKRKRNQENYDRPEAWMTHKEIRACVSRGAFLDQITEDVSFVCNKLRYTPRRCDTLERFACCIRKSRGNTRLYVKSPAESACNDTDHTPIRASVTHARHIPLWNLIHAIQRTT